MMKKIIFWVLLIALIIASSNYLIKDISAYLIVLSMASAIILILKYRPKSVQKLTYWAKNHPKKAIGLISVLQFFLLALGIYGGYNLNVIGIELSFNVFIISTAVILVGFLFVPFLPKKNAFVLPKTLQVHRFGYLSILLAFFLLATTAGNRVVDLYPNSPITEGIQAFDQLFFSHDELEDTYLGAIEHENSLSPWQTLQGNTVSGTMSLMAMTPLFVVGAIAEDIHLNPTLASTTDPVKLSKKEKRKQKRKWRKNLRIAVNTGMCALAVITILFLVITACAGICLIIAAIGGGFATVGAAIGAGLGGLVITGASIFGMIKVAKWCKKE